MGQWILLINEFIVKRSAFSLSLVVSFLYRILFRTRVN